ncbi:MAG TPA: prolyl oligopeptidase family serine peptidase [Solirubrobacterales bacterium]|nr:prolyl oligopeptidase family serine peptidase [Solirubrobacterales bacterium]
MRTAAALPPPGGRVRAGIGGSFALGRAAVPLALLALALLGPGPAAAAPPPDVEGGRSLAPQLLLIHGGSFLGEDPSFEALTEPPARAAGFVPHYVEYPLGDLPAAVRAVRAEAARLRRAEAGPVYAYGSSAGGTLAALLAGDGLVDAAVAKAPPSDLPTWQWPLIAFGPDYLERIGLTPLQARRLSPQRRPARRPLLIVQGRRDAVVPLAMNEAFAAKFQRVHLWPVPGGHWTERTRPWLIARSLTWLRRVSAMQGDS